MKKLLSNLTFKKLIYNKKFLIAVSIIISVIIWLTAAIVRNPIREKTFSNIAANITLKDTVASEKYGLQIVSDISSYKFTVTVKAPAHVIRELTQDDFTLKADVSNINEPKDKCDLKIVSENLSDKQFEVLSIEPATVTVKIDRVETKEFDLTARTLTEIKTDTENKLFAELPELTDTTQSKINITGAVTEIAKIKSVAAVADYSGEMLTKTKTFDAYIVIYGQDDAVLYKYNSDGTAFDANGKEIKSPEITPEFTSAKVTITILKKVTFNVVPSFENLPADMSVSDISYSLSPRTVTVMGPPDVVSNLEQVNLKPIDYKSITASNRTFKVKANLVGSVTIDNDSGNETEFTVWVNSIRGNRYYK